MDAPLINGAIIMPVYTQTPLPARIAKYHDPNRSPSPTPSLEGGEDADARDHDNPSVPPGRSLDMCSAVAFHGNFIMGSGFLGIPWAFSQAGVGLGSVLLLFITIISFATAMMTVEVMAVAEAVTRRAFTLAGAARTPPAPRTTLPHDPSVNGEGARAPSLGDYGGDSPSTLSLPEEDAPPPPAPGIRHAVSVGAAMDQLASTPPALKLPPPVPRATSEAGGEEAPLLPAPPTSPQSATIQRTCSLCVPFVALIAAVCGKRAAATAACACSEESHTAAVPPAAKADPVTHPYLRITRRKFEIVELVGMFLGGVNARRSYTALVGLYLAGAIWAYANVFALACAAHLRLEWMGVDANGTYQVYVLVFGVVVLGMACLDIREQKTVQRIMTGFRLVVMTAMLATVAAGAAQDGEGAGWSPLTFPTTSTGAGPAPDCATGGANGTTSCASGGYMQFTPAQAWSGVSGVTAAALARMTPIAVYSQLFHVAIPVLAQPLHSKTRLASVYAWTYTLTTVAYLALAVGVTLFFGAATEQSSNLNWVSYGLHSPALRSVSYLIVLFPALDVVTITSISVITLASNTMAAWYGPAVAKVETSSWTTVVAFRLAGGVPPIVGALLVRDFATVLDFTGLLGILIAFVVPPWLWLNATFAFQCIWSPTPTPCPALEQGAVHGTSAPNGTLDVTGPCAACSNALRFARAGRCPCGVLPVDPTPPMGEEGPGRLGDSPYLGWWSTPAMAWPLLWFGVLTCAFVLLVLLGGFQ